MAILLREARLLFQQSGNRCAYPTCTKSLSFPKTAKDAAVSSSEIAHIVGESEDGPRGKHPMPLAERNRYENLILLCEEHHHLVDTQVATFPVDKLRQMKFDHESLIAEATRRAVSTRAANVPAIPLVQERLYSSLLPVERLPKYVFSMECEETDETEAKKKLVRINGQRAAPLIIRANRLYCFQDLRHQPGPFVELAAGRAVEREDALSWWNCPDKHSWYVALLNRALNKLTGWRGLNLDKDHHRYFFEPDEPGKPKSIPYRPMNQATSELQVVWQPITKKTGLPKKFWYHRAIALKFVHVAPRMWCLAMRPEMRVTRDTLTLVIPRRIGGRVTKKKSRMFNFDVLEELNFWRMFFFENRPHLIMRFSDRSAIAVSANFLSQNVSWPGVPPERARTFKNALLEEDMFDQLELDQIDEDKDDEWGDLDDDD